MATPSLAMIPSAYADSKVYSVLPNNGDGDFTFNRDSSATRVGQNGLIQTVGYYSNNLVTNGTFDTDSDWTKGSDWTISGGKGNLALSDNPTNSTLTSTGLVLDASKTYLISYNISNYVSGGLAFVTGNISIPSTNGFHKFEYTGQTNFSIKRFGGASQLSIDNISIKEVLGDQPRLNYDISNGVVQSCPSLLLEGASTNLVTYSEDFSQSAWTKTNTSITSNSTISPDGNLNADSIVGNGASGLHYILNSVTVSSGQNYTFSIFAKVGTNNFFQLNMGGAPFGSTNYCNFNLSNGTIGSFGNTTSNRFIEKLGNNWYRIGFTGTSLSSGSANFFPMLITSATSSFLETNTLDTSVQIYGAQLEESSYATSYIPTNGSSQTRAAETCNDAGNAATFNDSEGVLYAEMAALADDSTLKSVCINDSTTGNRVIINYSNQSNRLTADVRVGAVGQAFMQTFNFTITNLLKIALKYKANDFALWVNGTEVATDNSGSTFSANTLNNLSFDNGAGGEDFYGKVKDIRVYNEALTDAQLQTLTTL